MLCIMSRKYTNTDNENVGHSMVFRSNQRWYFSPFANHVCTKHQFAT